MTDNNKIYVPEIKHVVRENWVVWPNFYNECNMVYICGVFQKELEFSHRVKYMNYYKTQIMVERRSGIKDNISVIISEILRNKIYFNHKDPFMPMKGKTVIIYGQYQSARVIDEHGKKHLFMYVYAQEILKLQNEDIKEYKGSNMICLKGTLDQKPNIRYTPMGKKVIDLFVRVPKEDNKTDYIPCIAWWEVADDVAKMKVGDIIKLCGRIQSRVYFKRNSPDSEEGRFMEVNEVSINTLE